MKSFEVTLDHESKRLHSLVERGALSEEEFSGAAQGAQYRKIGLESILLKEYDLSRNQLLLSLSEYYHCPWVEYDERLPVPPELLKNLNGQKLIAGQWFPILKDGETVVIAAHNPRDQRMIAEVQNTIEANQYKFWVALTQDITAFIQDFLQADSNHLIGNERTGLAFWRTMMAQWRTRLACYRNDFARAKTQLIFFRGGIGLIIIARALISLRGGGKFAYLYWVTIGLGLIMAAYGLWSYYRFKRSSLSPPRQSSLVEVTAAVLLFLENYQFVEAGEVKAPLKRTMLGRLADSLTRYHIFIEASFDNRERSYLAHRRNFMAAQRTVTACYRTIYARARTGLSFIRTGVALISIGLASIEYFSSHPLYLFDLLLILSGVWMIIDGASWYLPVREEQKEFPPPPLSI